MYGRSVYSVWLAKYGKEGADRRDLECREKKSKKSSGKNNPMYGKSSPNGSGQGWKGWYKDFFFRSLRELSYVLYLEEYNIKWTSGEHDILIRYKNYDGSDRTYRPDFYLPELKKVIEIKPKRLQKSPLIKLKTKAAIKHCENLGLEYEILDYPINLDKIKSSLNNGLIKFQGKYLEKFLNYINKI